MTAVRDGSPTPTRRRDDQPQRRAGIDPRRYARTAGLLFLVLLVLGPFSIFYVPSVLVEAGDAAATADNVAAHESLFRLGILSDTVIFLTEVVLCAVLYVLFRPAHAALSLAAALGRLAQAAVMGANLLLYLVVLLLLGESDYLGALDPGERDALALLFFDVHAQGVYVGQAFFGLSLLLLGAVVLRSRLVPRLLGYLVLVAGSGYLVDSLGVFLFPGLEGSLSVLVGLTSLVGELPFFLWLLIRGVDRGRWHELVGGSSAYPGPGGVTRPVGPVAADASSAQPTRQQHVTQEAR